MAECREP